MGHHQQVHDNREKQAYGRIVDVIIPTNLVCVLVDPAITTSPLYFIVFYAYRIVRIAVGLKNQRRLILDDQQL